MASIFNAVATTGWSIAGDGSGVAKLQSNGVTTNALAWCNFGYVSSAITIRSSYNTSSVTRSSTGVYVVSFTTNTSDANYSVISTANTSTTTYGARVSGSYSISTSGFSIATSNNSNTALEDEPLICFAIFGN